MPLSSGARLGQYEIQGSLGAGGMGEVYRAKDSKLARDVALKVLPELFASDSERLQRFQREARLLASLNHPNIAHLYGLERQEGRDGQEGVPFIVMELVEGPTLADRLASESPIPLSEALPIARQIADALEAAHEQGIIHRDLKPANIKVRNDDTVKVLDFGLAKALDPIAATSSGAMSSPTITAPTMHGVILGTAAYMSPEQARGKTVDKRSDVWAFGCVLYEMLTGKRAFEGDEVSDTLAFIITKDVDWTRLPADTPASIRKVLRRCLEKDRTKRLGDIHDARLDIDEAIAAPVAEGSASPGASTSAPGFRRTAWVSWAVTSVLALGLSATLAMWRPWRPTSLQPVVRASVALGTDASLVSNLGDTAILSPDGKTLVFVAAKQGTNQIYVRRLDQLTATPLAGTSNARGVFISPDSQWLGFFADGRLKKIAMTGGAAITLADAPDDRGGAWADDGSIVFVPKTELGTSIFKVGQSGGTPEVLIKIPSSEVARFPRVLPGSKAVIYAAAATTTATDDVNVVVQSLSSGDRKELVRGGYDVRYLPSGHLMYVHENTVFAVPFDPVRLEAIGSAVPILENVTTTASVSALFSVSDTGTLVYLEGGGGGGVLRPIGWMDRAGKVSFLRTTMTNWSNPHFSPDGSLLAMDIGDATGGQLDVWVYDWARDTPSRLTFDAHSGKPVWTPDGKRIVFTSNQNTATALFWQRADGTGQVQALTQPDDTVRVQLAASWHPSGKWLAYAAGPANTSLDLMILPVEGDEATGWKPGKPTVFLRTPASEQEPMFSPDGRWIAYMSTEDGRPQIYVRPFPGPGGKWLVSSDGGGYPTWSRTRPELLYRTVAQATMAVRYRVEGDSFRAEKPFSWTEGRSLVRPRQRSYDLHPDGERLAVSVSSETQNTERIDHVTMMFNFFDELKRIAPANK